MAGDWCGFLGGETLQVDFADVRTHAGDKMAVVSAAATFSAFSADDGKLRSLTNRFTTRL